ALDGLPLPLLAPLALADVDVAMAVLAPPDAPDWVRSLAHATNGRAAAIEAADIVVALRTPLPDEIRSLRRGASDAPERGARLVLDCRQLTAGVEGDVALELSGPGVNGTCQLGIDGLPPEVFETISAANGRFPMGIDTFLIGRSGELAGLPRTTHIRIEPGGSQWATQP
ncbi:MAG: phosphonate C-P lyase system protein PhnH, partial [Chloroflexi bacterium]|nr:phosphonate C-P lyase system protein PhnH [Chloroflexota bacterium]